ncbi:ABC transporter permease subunit [Sutcliffiella horikoshii]|uniref:Glutathione transport system permease protein GsiD n=1 Tax=Sutcliffiella horikoshii TaxID=79883 RepID=A0AA94WTL5_9BACI|nr:ABC transporter permease subunit [Sutcliffiella horikoshii]TYS60805.1 ABC transporter permease subunit [Sutcliffiella horikoshii]
MSKKMHTSYSPFKVFLHKFIKQRFAFVAFIIVAFIVLVGVFGSWIAPFDPYRPVTLQYEEKGIDSENLTSKRIQLTGMLSDGSTITGAELMNVKVESEDRRIASIRRMKDGVTITANTSGATKAFIESEGVRSLVGVNVSNDTEAKEPSIVRIEADQPNEIMQSGDRYTVELKAIMTDGTSFNGLDELDAFLLDGQEDKEGENKGTGFVSAGSSEESDGGVEFLSLDEELATVSQEGLVTLKGQGDALIQVVAGSVSTIVHLPVGVQKITPKLVSIVPETTEVSLVDIYKHQPPSSTHLFGTDHQNRDIFSRVVMGTRETLIIGFVSVAIGAVIGTAFGLIAGYYGGRIDSLITRFTDILLAFPGILLAIAVIAFLGAGLTNIIFAVAVFTIPIFIRIVRGSTLALKEMTYVEAAQSIGVKDSVIIMRHIFPGTLSVVIVYLTMRIGVAILIGAALSFLGLGGDITAPEWGSMLSAAKDNSGNVFHPTFFPGLAIVITVLSFNILGDGLRDALDPKLKE